MSERAVPWWGVASSAVPPLVLAAGWMVAAFLQVQPYDPVADTVSGLAGLGAADRWVMTLAFAVAAACEIATGVALLPARTAGRLILVTAGAAGVLVAAFPVRSGFGAPVEHVLWAVIGLTALSVWPAGAYRHGPGVPWALRPGVSAVVAVILLGLLAWFGLELVTSGG